MVNSDKLFETKNRFTSSASAWLRPMQILNVALIFGAILLLGLMDFATLKFDFSQMYGENAGTFWGKTIIKALAMAMVYFSSSSSRTQNLLATDNDYLVISKFVSHVSRKSRSDQLNAFLCKRNIEIKKMIYKAKIEWKIERLERFARMKDLLAWKEYQEAPEEEKEQYLKNRYVNKKVYMLSIRSDKFIDENIDILKVKYHKINEWQLKSGKNKSKIDENPLAKSGEGARVMQSSLVLFRVIIFGAVMSAMLVDTLSNHSAWESIINLVSTIFTILWTATSGNYNGKTNFDDFYKYKMEFRLSLFKDYIDYEKSVNDYAIPLLEESFATNSPRIPVDSNGNNV